MGCFRFAASVEIRILTCIALCFVAVTIKGQTPTPIPIATPAPTLPTEPPPVAPNFEAPIRPLPSVERVGVDLSNQLSLTIDQAIELALKNNNNIDISRNNLQVNQFNFRAARGVYDPLITSENYYESATTPTASAIGGAVNGAVTQNRYFTSGGVIGLTGIIGLTGLIGAQLYV